MQPSGRDEVAVGVGKFVLAGGFDDEGDHSGTFAPDFAANEAEADRDEGRFEGFDHGPRIAFARWIQGIALLLAGADYDDQPPAGFKNALQFPEPGLGRPPGTDGIDGESAGERVVFEWERLGKGLANFDVTFGDGRAIAAGGLVNHHARRVDADGAPGDETIRGGLQREPGPAADLDQVVQLLKLQEVDGPTIRVPAAKGHEAATNRPGPTPGPCKHRIENGGNPSSAHPSYRPAVAGRVARQRTESGSAPLI